MWYRFTASANNATEYSIYNTGSLGTVGYLYDANGDYIAENDDNDGMNFGMSILIPHCCRATYVSIMQSVRVQLETISHLVGHTTRRITESRYLSIYDEVRQDALDRFDQRFGQIEQNSTVVS